MKGTCWSFALFVVLLLGSCSKKESTKYQNLQRTVEANNTDTLKFVVNEGSSSLSVTAIVEMPQHALSTKLERESGSGKVSFYYLAQPNYVGEDFVKFKLATDGSSEPAEISYIHLTINVK